MSGAEKVAAVAVCAAMCAVVVRKRAPEIALVLTLAAGTGILLYAIRAGRDAFAEIRHFVQAGEIPEGLFTPVLKITGIAVITRITAGICHDAKESGLAGVVETAGTVLALIEVMPLMEKVLSTVSELL